MELVGGILKNLQLGAPNIGFPRVINLGEQDYLKLDENSLI